ncbi:alpha/beta fold hydrolase [Christiangramia salexigens]|uniref:Alpha/beta hydrolase n=1 Tax=Christiangramia salexigens TaxID=1913577 RepID=A0A1L3J2P4_9FLAO|nr:alpha/beta hydrolase [Christiangramia salexigens]APG59389.1 alpha/beta hydrolase [Christiangramia salexigens]
MTKETKDKLPVQRLLVPDYILKFSKFLTKISPFLASRFAARLFLTPFRYKLPNREKEMYEDSVKTMVKVPYINREIKVYEYGSTNKKVLLVHGWSGRGTQLSKIAKELKANGFSTLSFDAPAHGDAPGKISMMPFFIKSIHFLDEKYGPFEAVIGHSLGGMSSLRAIKDGLSTKSLVIIGTANSVTKITRDFAENMKMNHKVAGKMKAYLDSKFGQDMDDYSGAVSALEVPTPSLVIHDEHDVDVNIKDAYEIDSALKNSELYITRGLGHRRILGDPAVINKITTFITAQSL